MFRNIPNRAEQRPRSLIFSVCFDCWDMVQYLLMCQTHGQPCLYTGLGGSDALPQTSIRVSLLLRSVTASTLGKNLEKAGGHRARCQR